jgi:SAM-dependent methyltransferase
MNRVEVIRSFDRIAEHSNESWSHNSHYHRYLLRHLPQGRDSALDIGSGLGQFSRILAGHFSYVEAVDFSPKMVEGAIARSSSVRNLRYRCEDFLEAEFAADRFDCITSIATFHHLPLRQALQKVRQILKPGGRLLMLDLYRNSQAQDYLFSAVGVVGNVLVRADRRENKSAELKNAWVEHAPLDELLTIEELKKTSRELLPKASIRRHVFFRYSLVWEKQP